MFLKARRVWSLFARIGTRQSVTVREFFKIEAKWCTMGGGVCGDKGREWWGARGRWEGKLGNE